MSTGIVGTIGASSSLNYTPSSNAKMSVTASVGSGGFVYVNGTVVSISGVGFSATFYVAAGQTVSVATGTSTTAVVSAIEENS
jgi:hypothetical protein